MIMKNNAQERLQNKATASIPTPVKKAYRKAVLKRLGVLGSVAASKVSSGDGGCYIRW